LNLPPGTAELYAKENATASHKRKAHSSSSSSSSNSRKYSQDDDDNEDEEEEDDEDEEQEGEDDEDEEGHEEDRPSTVVVEGRRSRRVVAKKNKKAIKGLTSKNKKKRMSSPTSVAENEASNQVCVYHTLSLSLFSFSSAKRYITCGKYHIIIFIIHRPLELKTRALFWTCSPPCDPSASTQARPSARRVRRRQIVVRAPPPPLPWIQMTR
jgi:hypothetical protein